MTLDLQQTLETLIDGHGLRAVLEGLADVARDKADHVGTNGDKGLEQLWTDAAAALDRSANRSAILRLANYEGR